jgi:hypothetical protein
LVVRLRRHHAIEHATIHILSQRHHNLRVVGRSTLNGFVLYGNLPTEAVLSAAQEALRRLQAGQRDLAVHPSCGTNFVTAGVLAGVGVFAILTPKRRSWSEWFNRLPTAILVATLSFILGQRLGLVAQTYVTTDADVSDARIGDVVREGNGSVVVHKVKIVD